MQKRFKILKKKIHKIHKNTFFPIQKDLKNKVKLKKSNLFVLHFKEISL